MVITTAPIMGKHLSVLILKWIIASTLALIPNTSRLQDTITARTK